MQDMSMRYSENIERALLLLYQWSLQLDAIVQGKIMEELSHSRVLVEAFVQNPEVSEALMVFGDPSTMQDSDIATINYGLRKLDGKMRDAQAKISGHFQTISNQEDFAALRQQQDSMDRDSFIAFVAQLSPDLQHLADIMEKKDLATACFVASVSESFYENFVTNVALSDELQNRLDAFKLGCTAYTILPITIRNAACDELLQKIEENITALRARAISEQLTCKFLDQDMLLVMLDKYGKWLIFDKAIANQAEDFINQKNIIGKCNALAKCVAKLAAMQMDAANAANNDIVSLYKIKLRILDEVKLRLQYVVKGLMDIDLRVASETANLANPDTLFADAVLGLTDEYKHNRSHELLRKFLQLHVTMPDGIYVKLHSIRKALASMWCYCRGDAGSYEEMIKRWLASGLWEEQQRRIGDIDIAACKFLYSLVLLRKASIIRESIALDKLLGKGTNQILSDAIWQIYATCYEIWFNLAGVASFDLAGVLQEILQKYSGDVLLYAADVKNFERLLLQTFVDSANLPEFSAPEAAAVTQITCVEILTKLYRLSFEHNSQQSGMAFAIGVFVLVKDLPGEVEYTRSLLRTFLTEDVTKLAGNAATNAIRAKAVAAILQYYFVDNSQACFELAIAEWRSSQAIAMSATQGAGIAVPKCDFLYSLMLVNTPPQATRSRRECVDIWMKLAKSGEFDLRSVITKILNTYKGDIVAYAADKDNFRTLLMQFFTEPGSLRVAFSGENKVVSEQKAEQERIARALEALLELTINADKSLFTQKVNHIVYDYQLLPFAQLVQHKPTDRVVGDGCVSPVHSAARLRTERSGGPSSPGTTRFSFLATSPPPSDNGKGFLPYRYGGWS